ncbi:DUF885 domain-containing protein [Coralloluteibacterium stylophorae]|uniref:DUF885 domain-containing protein n=1 Tax=Coralloluteibacterium stylophorae TaxID=1776034 RepID=A0A8J7VYX0_9GAMM|nr:DUF885 domain-containing protein [Coralloluteibacterium stylophorae]MBS7455607.1 DUF885 domain-containing protein [Coralloluteibacterium stylophorae]
MTRHLLALALAAALAGCGADHDAATPADGKGAAATAAGTTADTGDAAARLQTLYAEFWEESLALHPLQATFVGDDRYNDRLPDTASAEFREKEHAFLTKWLERARAIDSSGLEGQDRLSYDIFVEELQDELEGERFPGWQQPLNQFYSFPSTFAMLGSGTGAQPFETVADYDAWLSRAGQLPALFDSSIANMREGMASGVVQPKVLMEKTLDQLDGLIKDDPTETLFWRPIAEMPESFSDADRERLTEAYRSLVADRLMPAYRELRAFVADEYLPAARDSVGLDALPQGAEWYAHNVRTITTTDLTPAQIHDIGLAEVERIHGEMREVMRQVGFEGSLQDFFAHVTSDPEFTYPSEDALLADYRQFEDEVNRAVPQLFSLTPEAGFEIRPVEAFRAKSAAGGSYMRPSEDGSRPGIFYVNTYDLPSRKTWDRDSLFLHEAIPGHHFQIALQQELDLPAFRRFGGQTAFIEGWGLYAESLGKELGVYDDPYHYFGRLQAELWRAIRLVVDTGLHSKGWSRDQVIAYMKENSATTDTEAVSETERYMAIPGQALAYKIGELKIRELRTRAEAELGDAFDIRAFHAEVLKDGSVPLDVLEAKIGRWIEAQRDAAA